MTGLRLCVVVAAIAVAAALAAGAPQAHATPPAIPCGFECKWPVGTYSIPERVEAGEEFEVSWSYTWDPQDALAAAAGAKGAPDGHYAVPGGAADVPPPGYDGSAVTLRLPQELEIVGWEGKGLKRERLWTDHYDRTMYEYTWANRYAESGTHDRSITVRLDGDGMFYPVTELVVDLGLSVADSPPWALFAVRGGGGASLSGEPPEAAGASGHADEYPHRQSLKWPEPTVEAAAMPTGVAGATGDDETYVYGYLQYNDRDGVARAAAGVRACVYDVGATDSDLTPLRGGAACAQTGTDGFYGVAVPREDPDGAGDADILVRFTTESVAVTTRTGQARMPPDQPYHYDIRDNSMGLGSALGMGRVTVPDTAPFRHALGAHVPAREAHEYFVNTFGYDAPPVTITRRTIGTSDGYISGIMTINMAIDPSLSAFNRDWTAVHEYAHHVENQIVGTRVVEPECRVHSLSTRTTDACAFSEGWASFVPALINRNSVLQAQEGFSYDLELGDSRVLASMAPSPRGSDVEGTVAAILWDIYDGHSAQEPADDIESSIQLLWDVLGDVAGREMFSAPSIHDFASGWEDAGYPSLGGVLEHNGAHAHRGATMHVLHGSGAAKVGDGATFATAGQTVRVIARVQGEAPSISFYGGAEAPMSPAGTGAWAGDYAVTPSSPNGPVRFLVKAGGAVTHTLHDVSPASRVAVDRTAPTAPSAKFTAPGTIALTFLEPLAPFEDAAFAVSPPNGSAPAVSASRDGRTVLLSLDPGASVEGQWVVSISASVTDLAGNAYAGGPVEVGFRPDSDPPTFTAKRVGPMSIAVEFSEDVQILADAIRLGGHFTLTDPNMPQRSLAPSVADVDQLNRRITLRFSQNVFAGTLEFSDTNSAGPVKDMLGNRLADGTDAAVTDDVDPVFRTRYLDGFSVQVAWDTTVTGTTSVSEWSVNEKRPSGFGERPGMETTTVGSNVVTLFVDGLVCAEGRIQVEYTRPGGGGANSLTADGGAKVRSASASDDCGRISSTGARFLDDRTISMELDRAAQDFVERFIVGGLGETIEFVEPGSKTVILHTSAAAAADTTYVVSNSFVGRVGGYASGSLLEPATYMDATPPTVRYAEHAANLGLVTMYLSEPLDASTLDGKVFTSATLGAITASYVAPERAIVLGHSRSAGAGSHTISVPAGIADVNGVPLASQDVTTTRRPDATLGSARFVDGHTLTLEASARLSAETLNSFTIHPSLGSIDAAQAGNTVTLSTAEHARHNTAYMVEPPFLSLDADGREVTHPKLKATYTDVVAPSVTGARFVSPQIIEVRLSEPLDPTSLAGASFGVVPTLGAPEAEYAAGATSITVRTPAAARPGTNYELVIPGGARDSAGLRVSPLRVPVTGVGTFLGGAAFASPSTVILEASAPLDASSVAGIEVLGLGRSAASYDPASRSVEVRTAKPAAGGATHRILVPASVLDASGREVGPLALEATNSPGGDTPRALRASTAAAGRVSVTFDGNVAPAGGSPGSLDASLWAVAPAGGEPIAATLAVAIGNTVWLRHTAAPAGTALAVTYTPGGGDGDVADRASRHNRAARITLPVEDLIPPTFAARTHSATATVVTFDKPVSGRTSVTEWAVEGGAVVGVSALAGGVAPSEGSAAAALGAGTERIALYHSRISPGARPAVSYSPVLGSEILAGSPMAAASVTAGDGVAPSVVAAAFTGPRTLHVELDESPGARVAAVGAFTVSGPGGNVGVDKASATARSATVTLTLSESVAPGEYTVTAGSAVVDAAGNAVSARDKTAVASWAAVADSAPSFEAKTSSPTSTVITFTPAVSGSTSAASWSVSGAAATGIARVGGAEVADPGAASVTLPDGTASITLLHAPLHGNLAEPIVRHHGTGITSGEMSLGNRAEKASEGIEPRLLSALLPNSAVVHLRFDEPVEFVGGSGDDRNSHWTMTDVSSRGTFVREVEIRPDDSDASVLVLRVPAGVAGTPYISYGGTRGEPGAVVDASGNGLVRFSDVVVNDSPRIPCLDPPRVGGVPRVNFCQTGAILPGDIPAFVFVGEDGTRVGTYIFHGFGDRVNVSIDPPLIMGQRYTMHSPEYVYDSGDTYGGANPVVFTFGSSDTTPPTVESARFAGPREVRVAFSEPLRAVPAGAAFSVTKTGGTAIPLVSSGVSHEAGLRTVTLSLSRDASPGAHEVRVPAAVTDLAGSAYATPSVPVPATYDAVAPTASSAAFTGERSVSLTVSEALDAATVGAIRVRGLGATSASYAAGSTTVTLHTQLPAAAGSSHAVVIPAGVTDANGVPLAPTTLWAARGDTAAPTVVGARTVSTTTTEVDFGEAVRLGDSPTARQHAAHWAVAEGAEPRAVTGAEVVRGGLSVRLTHAPIGTSAMPSVSYVKGTDDDASVRDWAAAPNYLASVSMRVAGDGLPPRIDSLTVSVVRQGEAGAPARVWARAGDTVRFAMSMSEAAGTNAPTIRLADVTHDMTASGGGRLAWTHDHTVPGMGAEQGALAFVVRASDGGGNAAYAEVPTSGTVAMVDTVKPSFTARTLGAGLVEVTLSEPVRGTISASEWTVGGAAGTGVAASAGSAPAAAVALDQGARFVLWHGGTDTGGTPEVRYGPPAA